MNYTPTCVCVSVCKSWLMWAEGANPYQSTQLFSFELYSVIMQYGTQHLGDNVKWQ